MNVRELRRLVADLDDDTTVWFDPPAIEAARYPVEDRGPFLAVEGAQLYPAAEDRGPCLVLLPTASKASMA